MVRSASNDNERFVVEVRYAGASIETCSELALLIDGSWVAGAPGVGWDDTFGCYASFAVPRLVARRVAETFGISREDRTEVGGGLRARFDVYSPRVYSGLSFERRRSMLAKLRPAEMCTQFIVARIENPAGAPEVLLRKGGRYRGPRNNRFAFRVRRDGVLLENHEAPDLGGVEGLILMAPSDVFTASASLDRWADVSRPGAYEVECRYETTLSPPDGPAPVARRDLWDRVFSGTVRFEVSPAGA